MSIYRLKAALIKRNSINNNKKRISTTCLGSVSKREVQNDDTHLVMDSSIANDQLINWQDEYKQTIREAVIAHRESGGFKTNNHTY